MARVQVGPEMRRGIAELDGEGEVAGGVIIMRSGKNAQAAIQAVKTRLAELAPSLPKGMELAVDEINANLTSVDMIARGNASATEEITASVMELSRIAESTRLEVDRFQTA